jgi:RNA polymerase sigma factor (sigma-70 family)
MSGNATIIQQALRAAPQYLRAMRAPRPAGGAVRDRQPPLARSSAAARQRGVAGAAGSGVRPVPQVIGRAYLSCIDTEITDRGWAFDVALPLDAHHPGTLPAPLPGATPVAGRAVVVNEQSGIFGDITGRRVGHAWLVVESSSRFALRAGALPQRHVSVAGDTLSVMADAGEFDDLYRRESEGVLVFFARRTLDSEVALDLTAETFAQAYCGWRGLRGGSREQRQAWLYTIARRRLSRYLRRGRVERRALRRLGVQTPVAHQDDLALIEERAGLEQLRAALSGELVRLSAEQRRALELRIVQERPYAEVARDLGISELAARARVSRGLRALGRALDVQLATGEQS